MRIGDREIRKISDDGSRKVYWTSTKYTHCRPVPGAPEPAWIRETGRVSSIVVWAIDDVDYSLEPTEGVENENDDEEGDPDIDLDQLFDLHHYFDEYDDDFCDGERGEE